jgi:predicted permease
MPDHSTSGASWTAHLRPRLAGLRLSPAREAEIIEELSQHLEARYEELIAAGVSQDEARRLALEELLEPETLAHSMQRLRQANVPPPMTPGVRRRFAIADLWQDVGYAARVLRKQPGFTAAAVITLALGIGANTAIFSLINATLLQRLPVANRDRLVYVWRGNVGGVFPYPLYASLRDNNRVFDGFAVWGGITASLNGDNVTDLVQGVIVTGNFFETLGVRPEHGRLLSRADDTTVGAHAVAVISHGLWQTRFAARPDIIGHDVLLNGHSFTIVGVTPPEFRGPQLGGQPGLYVPMMMQAIMRPPRAAYSGEMNPDLLNHRTNSWLFGVARLKPGVTPEQARADLIPIEAAYPSTVGPGARAQGVAVLPVDEGNPAQRQRMRLVALLLGGVVGAVLLIACANIANMLLARAAARRREFAVRLALGACTGRLFRQLLTESVLLSLVGGLLGLGLAWAVARAVAGAPPPRGALPLAVEFAIDSRVLMFSFALSVLTGITFGALPARRATKPSMVPALKDAAADSAEHGRRLSLQKTLVVAEVALSMLLLIPAGLFVRSLQAARAIDPGFDVDRIVSAPLSINLLRYTSAQGREFYRQVIERAQRVPGVDAASVARVPVLNGTARMLGFLVEGQPGPEADFVFSEGGAITRARNQINVNVISPGFFKTMGIPLMSGRDFGDQDSANSPRVVVINQTTARMYFGTANPLGARVSFRGQQGPWHEIVGVVGDSKYATLGEDGARMVYMPVAQNHETGMTLYVRTSVPPEAVISSLRREIQALEPNLPVPDIATMRDTVATSLFAPRLGAWLIALFGGLALLLAAIGVYGVLSFSIARRTREMGIRFALGAKVGQVFLLVIRDGMMLVGVGMAIGMTAGVVAARSLASFLYGVSTSDVTTFVVATLVLLIVALVACMIPAKRAVGVDPIVALRYE